MTRPSWRKCAAGCGFLVLANSGRRTCKPCRDGERLKARRRSHAGLCRYTGTCKEECPGACSLEALERQAEAV